MTVLFRGGYWVTDDTEALNAFLTQTSERYIALEQALKPISAVVIDLERDWTPRWVEYWQRKTKALITLRTETQTCLHLFAKECSSQTAPVALVLAETSITYRSSLRHIEKAIEEAGILITFYSSVCRSLEEKHIRQRQRVLEALRTVDRATFDAIIAARTGVEQAPMLHVRLTHTPSETTEVQHGCL